MLAWAMALLLGFAPPGEGDGGGEGQGEGQGEGERPDAATADAQVPADSQAAVEQTEESTAPVTNAELVLIPSSLGSYAIVDGHSQTRQLVQAGPEQPARVDLAPGVYTIESADGQTLAVAVLVASRPMVWDGEQVVAADAWTGRPKPALPPQPIPPPLPISQPRPAKKPNHKRWASPLLSTLIPGTGQILNGQGGKGVGLLFGTLGSIVGATVLYRRSNDGTRPPAAEYARLVGYGVFSTAAPMLWIYAIADAYRVANDQSIDPRSDYKVRFSLQRTMTVGFRADARRPGFYDNWSGALMGQAARRLTVGVADISFGVARSAPGSSGGQLQFGQFGLRLDYRVYEHPRLWLDLGLGTTMQVASVRDERPLDPEAEPRKRELVFAAIPYGYFDVRVFVLDRLSLDFTPRLSVPVTTRYFSANRALPRFAPTLELGAGVSVYF